MDIDWLISQQCKEDVFQSFQQYFRFQVSDELVDYQQDYDCNDRARKHF